MPGTPGNRDRIREDVVTIGKFLLGSQSRPGTSTEDQPVEQPTIGLFAKQAKVMDDYRQQIQLPPAVGAELEANAPPQWRHADTRGLPGVWPEDDDVPCLGLLK